jgi:hypothetical protein
MLAGTVLIQMVREDPTRIPTLATPARVGHPDGVPRVLT